MNRLEKQIVKIRTRFLTPTGKTNPLRVAWLLLATVGLLLTVPLSASAEYLLGTAKASGQIGEKQDGYLQLLDEKAPENIKKMVVDTNQRRAARYQLVAERLRSTVEVVGKRAGAGFIERAQPGELIETADGKWEKKK